MAADRPLLRPRDAEGERAVSASAGLAQAWDLHRCIDDLHQAIREKEDERAVDKKIIAAVLARASAALLGPNYLDRTQRIALGRELADVLIVLEAMP